MKIIKYIIATILLIILMVGTVSADTLIVGSTAKYKTIQSAVLDAKSGDTINVNSGVYKENILIEDKSLNFIGQKDKYPVVCGFQMSNTDTMAGAANIKGFKITKYGVSGGYVGGNTIQNNYFSNCGVAGGGSVWSYNKIINNQFTNGGIYIDDMSRGNIITGNTFTKSKVAIGLYTSASCDKISGNTFKNCIVAFKAYSVPACLVGNKYIGNKINIQTGDV